MNSNLSTMPGINPTREQIKRYLALARLRALAYQNGFHLTIRKDEIIPIWAASITRIKLSTEFQLELKISSHLIFSSRPAQRLMRCLNYWLPRTATHIQLNQQDTRFNFCSDDAGDESMLSMDSKNTRWLIPDEYSMQDFWAGRHKA